MRKSRRDLIDEEITTHRARTERRLAALLDQTQSRATLDDIKTVIFNEHEARSFSDYVGDLVTLFDTGPRATDIDDLLPALQDAWNYFAHRRYGGQCPAKRMPRQEPSFAPNSLRTQTD